jgi:hypothetical protein
MGNRTSVDQNIFSSIGFLNKYLILLTLYRWNKKVIFTRSCKMVVTISNLSKIFHHIMRTNFVIKKCMHMIESKLSHSVFAKNTKINCRFCKIKLFDILRIWVIELVWIKTYFLVLVFLNIENRVRQLRLNHGIIEMALN